VARARKRSSDGTRYVSLIRSGVVKQLVQPLAVQREQLDNSGYPANRELSGHSLQKH
jgi:hypothetical protein